MLYGAPTMRGNGSGVVKDDYAAAPAPRWRRNRLRHEVAATRRRASLDLMPNARARCRSVGPLSWRYGDRWTNDVAPGDDVRFAQPIGRGVGVGTLASKLA